MCAHTCSSALCRQIWERLEEEEVEEEKQWKLLQWWWWWLFQRRISFRSHESITKTNEIKISITLLTPLPLPTQRHWFAQSANFMTFSHSAAVVVVVSGWEAGDILILDNFGTTCTSFFLQPFYSDQMFYRMKLWHIIIHTISFLQQTRGSRKNIKKQLRNLIFFIYFICGEGSRVRVILTKIDTSWRMMMDKYTHSQCQFFYDIIIRMFCIL